ncbi:hypothetical protein [Pseudoalteromonas piscicida]|uniref:hypothetical protein n=1 Tax=Pseudoalteromonas piscicida TaxID=43662 RepID=UPI0030A2AD71
MITSTTRNWWFGLLGFWLKECGAANFFIPGVIAAILAPWLFLVEDRGLQSFSLTFSISALWMAFCWQIVKLQAQENALLLPELKLHVYKQGWIILAFGYALNSLALIEIPLTSVASGMLFSSAFCGCFFLLSMRNSAYFKHNSYFFMLILMLSMFFGEQPMVLVLLSLPPTIISLYLIATKQKNCQWHPLAYQTYLNNIQTGWLPVKTFSPEKVTQKFRQVFMPMSYFAGNILVQTSQVFILAGVLSIVAAAYFGTNVHFLVILMDMLLVMIAIFICWSKLQTKMSWDRLYLLPIYSSLNALKRAYHFATVKLALCLSLYQLAVIVVCDTFLTMQPVNNYLIMFVGSITGFLLCIAIGSIVRNAITLSLSCMLVLALHSAFKAYLLSHAQTPLSLFLLVIYSALVAALLLYANRKVR